jgi:hypothetical protein
MKKLFTALCIFVLTLYINTARSQQQKTLYEIGDSLTTPEVNFKNLFSNFPKYVVDSGGVTFLNYTYLGNIESKSEVIDYLKEELADNGTIAMERTISRDTNRLNQNILTVGPPPDAQMEQVQVERAVDLVPIGAKIFVVHYIRAKKTHKFYVFIDPKTNEVVKHATPFAFEVDPSRHYRTQ